MSHLLSISKRFADSYYQLYGLRVVSSNAQFCESVGLHPQNFKKIERGDRKPTLEHVFRLCLRYNISPDWLLFGTGDLFSPKKETKAIVEFSGILEKAMDRYTYNKDFSPDKLTDANLEKCVEFYSEKLRKNMK